MIEGSYRSWDFYTTGQLVDGLQQQKKKIKKRKPVFIKRKWNHVFSRATILSFHLVLIICLLTMKLFGFVLWHINNYRLFKAKTFLYIYQIYDFWRHFLDNIFKRARAHFFLLTVKWFHLFLSMQIILFTINYLFAHSYVFQVLLLNTKNSIKHQSLAYTELNNQTVLFPTIQFSMSTKFNSSKYYYVSRTIQLNIRYLLIHS